jgi:PhnB protein
VASRLNPYLSFDGNAREAMEFYEFVFGGDLELNTYGEFGPADASQADKIIHSQLETGKGYVLMGSDLSPDTAYDPGNTISVSLTGDDAEDLRGYWEKLADGGTVAVPLEKQMWGDEFGMCTDKFGITWMINISVKQ